jgi:hypothetical protein
VTINNKKIDWLILILLSGVYIFFAFFYNKNLFALSDLCYYNYLINAFLHQRLDLIIDFHHDLSLFNNKWYMYWGPAPIFYILPFYLFGRLNTSDVFYTLIAGIANIYLFYFVAKELILYFNLKIKPIAFWVIMIGFAFVSPNFYLSLTGAVWQTNQIVGLMYLLFFLLFYFKYLNTNKKLYLFFSSVFFNLAWLSRYTLIFYGLLYLFLIKKKKFLISRIIIPLILALLIFFSYNYWRFNNIFETGFRYQQVALRYLYFFNTNQIFSLINLPYNFYYYFFHPIHLSFQPLRINFDPEGNSVFLMYPLLIFHFGWLIKKIKNKNITHFRNICFGIVVLILGVLLTNIGSGWRQFGIRYFLDVIVLLYLLLFFVIKNFSLWYQMIVLLLGSLLNIGGYFIFRQQ